MDSEVRETWSYCSCDGNEWKEITRIQSSSSLSLNGRTHTHMNMSAHGERLYYHQALLKAQKSPPFHCNAWF